MENIMDMNNGDPSSLLLNLFRMILLELMIRRIGLIMLLDLRLVLWLVLRILLILGLILLSLISFLIGLILLMKLGIMKMIRRIGLIRIRLRLIKLRRIPILPCFLPPSLDLLQCLLVMLRRLKLIWFL